jgi:hypothetical protein
MKEKADLRSYLLAIRIKEMVLLFLMRHIVFLDEESFIGNSDKRKGSFISNETHCVPQLLVSKENM